MISFVSSAAVSNNPLVLPSLCPSVMVSFYLKRCPSLMSVRLFVCPSLSSFRTCSQALSYEETAQPFLSTTFSVRPSVRLHISPSMFTFGKLRSRLNFYAKKLHVTEKSVYIKHLLYFFRYSKGAQVNRIKIIIIISCPS